MHDDNYSGERIPGRNPETEKTGEYAEIWDEANMADTAPEFAGDDPYNPEGANEEGEAGEGVEKKRTDGKYGGAEDLTSYGLDTAAKIYGLDTVIKVVKETDETGRDAMNPMASIYDRLAPDPDEKEHLFNEIYKDDEESDKQERRADEPEDVNNAIHQMKVLLDALENDPRFSDVRERAANEGKDVVSYLVSGNVNPTLSNFFDGLDAAGGGNVEQILDEIAEEEKEKQIEEFNSEFLQ